MGAASLFSYYGSQRKREQKAAHDKADKIISAASRRLLPTKQKGGDLTARDGAGNRS